MDDFKSKLIRLYQDTERLISYCELLFIRFGLDGDERDFLDKTTTYVQQIVQKTVWLSLADSSTSTICRINDLEPKESTACLKSIVDFVKSNADQIYKQNSILQKKYQNIDEFNNVIQELITDYSRHNGIASLGKVRKYARNYLIAHSDTRIDTLSDNLQPDYSHLRDSYDSTIRVVSKLFDIFGQLISSDKYHAKTNELKERYKREYTEFKFEILEHLLSKK